MRVVLILRTQTTIDQQSSHQQNFKKSRDSKQSSNPTIGAGIFVYLKKMKKTKS